MTIGEIIKKYRASQNISQREFAIKCGLSNGIISIIEKGTNPKTNEPIIPTLPTINSLAKGMGMKIDNLLEMLDDMDVSLSRNLNIEQTDRAAESTKEKGMTVENSLKALILERFKSVRAFAAAIGKPYSSVNNIFLCGVSDAGISTVIPLCRALGIDADALVDGEIKSRYTLEVSEILTPDEKHLLDCFRNFNEEGQEKVLDTVSDMTQLDRYKKRADFEEEWKEA